MSSRYSGYKQRNKRLRAISGISYQQYLASNEWKSLRAIALDRDRDHCVMCGAVAVNVHHSNYGKNALRNLSAKSLWSLCRECHLFVEFSDDGVKTNLTEMRRRMVVLAVKHSATRTIDRMKELGWNNPSLWAGTKRTKTTKET